MAIKLKSILVELSAAQSDLAREVKYSPAAIAALCDHGQWPIGFKKLGMEWGVLDFLERHGATEEQLIGIFDEDPKTCTQVGGE